MTVTVQGLSDEVREAMFNVAVAMGQQTPLPMPSEMVGAALGVMINNLVALEQRIAALEQRR